MLEGNLNQPETSILFCWTSTQTMFCRVMDPFRVNGHNIKLPLPVCQLQKKARVAFRYYVPDGGPQGVNGLGVGLDKFEFISSVK